MGRFWYFDAYCVSGVNVHGTKWAKNANIWPKMTKNAYFGPNLAVFGPKILILMGGSKSFGTHVTENHLGTLYEAKRLFKGKLVLILGYILHSFLRSMPPFVQS